MTFTPNHQKYQNYIQNVIITHKGREFIICESVILQNEPAYLFVAKEVYLHPKPPKPTNGTGLAICSKVQMYDFYRAEYSRIVEYVQNEVKWYPIEFLHKLNDPMVDILYGD